MLQMLNITRTNNTRSLAGTNCDVMQTMNFLIASFFVVQEQ